ncbi:MAG: hypothetical protein EHM28_04955 [Spirochaetaceae bacterium]|nr:MAG: hypothetical protein EHM28_04955 [Spirochaetaceae bacterium]
MKYTILCLLFLTLVPCVLFAQDVPEPRDPFLFTLGVRLLGVDIGLGYIVSDTSSGDPDTILWAIAGGGYEWLNFFRDPNNEEYDGSYMPGIYDPEESPYYVRVGGRFDLGIAQGILFNKQPGHNLFEAFAFYRIRYDFPLDNTEVTELLFDSSPPETDGLFQNSVIAGLTWHDLDTSDPHLTINGIYAETSVEWGPEWLMNDLAGRADFLRFNLTAKGFLLLFDIAPREKLNLLSGYAGFFFAADYCLGDTIPLNIQQTIGGRNSRWGLGYAVRGYEDARFDGQLKAVLNLEYRMNISQFNIGLGNVTPGIVIFFDSGYYDYVYYDNSGFLFSAGAGVYINLLGFTSLTFYTAFPFSRELAAGGWWMPFAIDFDAHF